MTYNFEKEGWRSRQFSQTPYHSISYHLVRVNRDLLNLLRNQKQAPHLVLFFLKNLTPVDKPFILEGLA